MLRNEDNCDAAGPASHDTGEIMERCIQCQSLVVCKAHCFDCAGAPARGTSRPDIVRYCDDGCKMIHYPTHYDECILRQCRRSIYRIGHFSQKILLQMMRLMRETDLIEDLYGTIPTSETTSGYGDWHGQSICSRRGIYATALLYKFSRIGFQEFRNKGVPGSLICRDRSDDDQDALSEFLSLPLP